MGKTIIIYKYLKFCFKSKHTKGFKVHSPYIYNFFEVIYDKNEYYAFSAIEQRRSEMKNEDTILNIIDFGTGSARTESVKKIANRSLKSAKFGQMMYRIIANSKSSNILELGTSLGITTSYLASVSKKSRCITMEGSPEIAKRAKKNFDSIGLDNIEVVVGNIDKMLDDTLNAFEKIDFVFIDANHQYKAVMEYFDKILNKLSSEAIVVIDDIYWSEGMERAWKEIQKHPAVTSSIDLFQLGILFFNKNLHNKEYIARY